MLLGLTLLGFIIGVAFSAYHKSYDNREMIGNIVVAVIAAIQAKILSSLLLLDNVPISQSLVLGIWVLGILYLKKLFLRPKNIRYLG